MAIGTTFKVAFDAKSVQRGLASIGNRVASIGKSVMSSLVAPFARLTAMLAPAALVGSMVAFGKASSEAAATIENMRAQFDLFTGSGAGTEKLLKDLRKIAVESPLDLKQISEGARSLLTYGVAAEEVSPIIEQLSEISAGSAERFDRISYAFGQISSIGRLMGTELRQLTEAGFNPLEFISKRTGESMIDLKARMEAGGIGINEVKDALKAATSEGGRFFGMNAKMAQTFSGRVSIMRDQWDQLLQGFGAGMNNGLKTAADAVTNYLPQIIGKFTAIGAYLGNAISDSVMGNYDKFISAGKLIGDIMGSAAVAAFQTGIVSLNQSIMKVLEDINPIRRLSEAVGYEGARGSQYGNPDFSSAFDAQMILRGVKQQAQGMQQGNQGLVQGTGGAFRYAQPGETSIFSDANGNKVIQLIEKVVSNTKEGAKF